MGQDFLDRQYLVREFAFFYMVTNHIKWVKTSWTYSTQREKDVMHNVYNSETANMRYSSQTGLWIQQANIHDAGTVYCKAKLGKTKVFNRSVSNKRSKQTEY